MTGPKFLRFRFFLYLLRVEKRKFMDWSFIGKYLPLFAEAAKLTLVLGISGVVLSILIGVICAWILAEKIPVLRWIVRIYVELARNTPLLIQLFFIYYGLPRIGLSLSPEVCGIAGLAFLGGAYMCETFRSGLEAVSNTQIESAQALGFSKAQIIWNITLPQAIARSIPGLTANVIFLLKETSVFSAISLMDLMFTAKDLIGLYYKTTESLFMLVIFYLLILLPVSIFGTWLERKVRYAEFGD